MKYSARLIVPSVLCAGLFIALGVTVSAQIPGAPQQHPIALVGGTIHPVSEESFAGTLIFDKGKITVVGAKVTLAPETREIDVSGKHVYPGLFDANTNIGLVEINAVRATRDYSETGQINPNVKAQVAVNPDSELIPVTRSNGVLLSLVAPRGGLISGTSAVLQLDGWTWEDLTLQADAGLHIDWPTMSPVTAWWIEKSTKEQLESRDKALQQLEDTFADARAYMVARAANAEDQPFDSRWEAMIPVLTRKMPVIVAADEIQQIQAAVAFSLRQKVKLIIFGGYDAERCATLLKQHEIAVIIGSVYRLPRRRSDNYDAPFTLAERLRKAGVQYCISGTGRFGASNVRNLPYHAATASAYGLPRDEALKAITLYPAEILGVDDRVGTLDVGKDATLIITDGNPLETTSNVHAAFVHGRAVDLTDRHKKLWKKYQQKYEQLKKP